MAPAAPPLAELERKAAKLKQLRNAVAHHHGVLGDEDSPAPEASVSELLEAFDLADEALAKWL